MHGQLSARRETHDLGITRFESSYPSNIGHELDCGTQWLATTFFVPHATGKVQAAPKAPVLMPHSQARNDLYE